MFSNMTLLFTGEEDARHSAEEMDLIRQKQVAYEYLCHLEEAKKLAHFSQSQVKSMIVLLNQVSM